MNNTIKPLAFSLSIVICMITGPVIGQEFIYHSDDPFQINVIPSEESLTPFKFLFIDRDQDGDQDLFIYSIGLDSTGVINIFHFVYSIEYQENVGTSTNPLFAPKELILENFKYPDGLFLPTAGDVNNDGIIDFAAMADIDTFGELQHMRFYFGIESESLDSFEIVKGNSLNLPPLTRRSTLMPELVDFDADGDLDLMLSGDMTSIFELDTTERVCLMARNNGSPSNPAFGQWFLNPFNVKQDTFIEIMTTGDIDNDGDVDVLGLVSSGDLTKLFFRENDPEQDDVMSFLAPVESPFGLPEGIADVIMLGPVLVDLDDDGDLDFFVIYSDDGDAALRYYENGLCESITEEINATICAGDTLSVGGMDVVDAGTYTIKLERQNGCDSIILLTLSVDLPVTVSITETICAGDTFYLNEENYTAPGTYEIVMTRPNDCDSIIELTLIVIPDSYITITDEICDGEVYTIGMQEFTVAGSYQIVLISSEGCDSIIDLQLFVNPTYTIEINEELCAGESYIIGGEEITESGAYQFNLTSAEGCDSIVNAILTFHIVDTSVGVQGNTLTASSEQESYQWVDCTTGLDIDGATDDSFIPVASGSYAVIITDQFGCEAMSECHSVVVTGSRDLILARVVHVYPNPADDKVYIRTNSNHVIRGVSIYDLAGTCTVVKDSQFAQGIELGSYAPGVYYISVEIDDTQVVKKLVIFNRQ